MTHLELGSELRRCWLAEVDREAREVIRQHEDPTGMPGTLALRTAVTQLSLSMTWMGGWDEHARDAAYRALIVWAHENRRAVSPPLPWRRMMRAAARSSLIRRLTELALHKDLIASWENNLAALEKEDR